VFVRKRLVGAVLLGGGLLAAAPFATALGSSRGADSPPPRVANATALGTGFTYQGRLTEDGAPANGLYDIRFILYDSETGGSQVGVITETQEDVSVTDGVFTTNLDFGAGSFNGDARWLEIAVRPGASVGTFTVLSPRQAVSATPYALVAQSAAGLLLPFSGSASTTGSNSTFAITQPAGGGIAISGMRTSTSSDEQPAIYALNNGGGAALQAESASDDGTGVQGTSTGLSGIGGSFKGATGIEVDGAIKVNGTNPAAFVQTIDTSGNTCASDRATIIDSPLTNGDVKAMVLVTFKATAGGAIPASVPALAVIYNPTGCTGGANKWVIYLPSGAFTDGDTINVLVIKQAN
jgi:hypothetical protein